MVAALADLPIDQNQDFVAVLQGTDPVGDNQAGRRLFLEHLAQMAQDPMLCFGIDR